MGEDAAYEAFRMMRWPDGEASCPRCGCCETYSITSRRRFKCVGCHHQFSVTSGTIFASRVFPVICSIVSTHAALPGAPPVIRTD